MNFSNQTKIVRLSLLSAVFLATSSLLSVAEETHEKKLSDAITELVLIDKANQPRTPLLFLQKLKKAGLKIKYHVVSNGGIQNVKRGSFSCFGTVSGKLGSRVLRDQDLSFGIFIEPDAKGYLSVQNDYHTKLLVEVIARDFSTGVMNFWELIGDGKTAQWHFRTDSFGISTDVARVNMELNPVVSSDAPLFGNTARCSACHTRGDMVMKELSFPHNDWLSPGLANVNAAIGRFKLKKGPNASDPEEVAASLFAEAISPEDLAQTVRASLAEAVKAQWESRQSKESDKQKLRAVFAPLEMNLESDGRIFSERVLNNESVEIPSSFFCDELISGTDLPIKIAAKDYLQALRNLGSSFAADETRGLLETNHAFLFPVRSFADGQAISYLISHGKIDAKTVFAILSIDAGNPVYSSARLELMDFVPENYSDEAELVHKIIENIEALPADKRSASASELLNKLKFDTHQLEYINQQILFSLGHNRRMARLDGVKSTESWLKFADLRRRNIQSAQTSSSPRGAILEGGLGSGGFRRIFPQYTALKTKS